MCSEDEALAKERLSFFDVRLVDGRIPGGEIADFREDGRLELPVGIVSSFPARSAWNSAARRRNWVAVHDADTLGTRFVS